MNNEPNGFAMVPRDSEHAYQICQSIAKSNLCPKNYQGQPTDIMLAAAMGQKLGLDIFASMQGIAVINGRPSLWGDSLRALILSHPELEDLVEEYEGEGDNLKAVCTITRKGMTPHTDTFSVQDAKDAGLWGQRTWKNFAKDMLLNRAFGRAARRRFADTLNGIHVAEEMQDAEQVKNVPAKVHDDTPVLDISMLDNGGELEPDDVPQVDDDDHDTREGEILTDEEIQALDGSVDEEA